VRARKTYSLLFGNQPEDEEKVIITDKIAEWDYGAYEGLLTHEIRAVRKEKGLDTERPWNIWADGCEEGEYVETPFPKCNETEEYG